ncbi:MAG: PAS domain S-box protein, partial [Planctomycetales bacterium]
MDALAAYLDGDEPYFELEYQIQAKNGEWKWIWGRGVCVDRDENNKPLRIIGTHRDVTERKQTEESLHRNEALLQSVMDHAPVLISAKDLRGRVIMANRRFEVLDGPSPEEFVGKSVFDLFPPAIAKELWDNDLAATEASGPIEVEESVYHQDETLHDYQTVKFPLHDENGVVFATCAISTDVTERKRANAELAKSREALLEQTQLFQSVMSSTSDGLVVIGGKSEFLQYNQAAERMLGSGVADVLAERDKNGSPEDSPWVRGFHGEDVKDAEVFVHNPENAEGIWCSVSVNPLRDAEGTADGILCAFRDVTGRKQSELDLRLRDRAIQSADEGIIIVDAQAEDMPVVFANEAFTRITGYAAEEILGRNSRFLQNDDQDQPALRELRDALAEGKRFVGELRNYRKDGSMFWNHLSVAPVHDEHGSLTHFVGIQNDVTRRKRAEAELARSEERLRSITENAPDFILQVDRQGTILFINRVEPPHRFDDVVGTAIWNWAPEEFHVEMRQALEEVFREGENREFESMGARSDGSLTWFNCSLSPIRIDGRVDSATLIARDDTQRKETDETMDRLQHDLAHVARLSAMGELVASITHEI